MFLPDTQNGHLGFSRLTLKRPWAAVPVFGCTTHRVCVFGSLLAVLAWEVPLPTQQQSCCPLHACSHPCTETENALLQNQTGIEKKIMS